MWLVVRFAHGRRSLFSPSIPGAPPSIMLATARRMYLRATAAGVSFSWLRASAAARRLPPHGRLCYSSSTRSLNFVKPTSLPTVVTCGAGAASMSQFARNRHLSRVPPAVRMFGASASSSSSSSSSFQAKKAATSTAAERGGEEDASFEKKAKKKERYRVMAQEVCNGFTSFRVPTNVRCYCLCY